MLYKTAPAEVKAEPDAEGTFEAIVSVFGNVDLMGDRVVKGAFADTLTAWADSGDPIPVVWSHQSFDPNMTVGEVLAAEERDEGLWVKGQLDLDTANGAQVWRLLSKRRVKQFSFAYDVDESTDVDGVNELHKITLYEVGPTPLGANPATELLGTKHARWNFRQAMFDLADEKLANASPTQPFVRNADDWQRVTTQGFLKAGRVLSSKNETKLRDAAKLLADVLAQLGDDDDKDADTSADTIAAGDGGDPETDGKALPESVRQRIDFEVAMRQLQDLET